MTNPNADLDAHVLRAVNILAKWRMVFAGWQLGTRAKGDPESDAVRDYREITLIMRAELSAFRHLLIEKNVFTQAEFQRALAAEAEQLSGDLETRFPGFRAMDYGMSIDPQVAQNTTEGWKP